MSPQQDRYRPAGGGLSFKGFQRCLAIALINVLAVWIAGRVFGEWRAFYALYVAISIAMIVSGVRTILAPEHDDSVVTARDRRNARLAASVSLIAFSAIATFSLIQFVSE